MNYRACDGAFGRVLAQAMKSFKLRASHGITASGNGYEWVNDWYDINYICQFVTNTQFSSAPVQSNYGIDSAQ